MSEKKNPAARVMFLELKECDCESGAVHTCYAAIANGMVVAESESAWNDSALTEAQVESIALRMATSMGVRLEEAAVEIPPVYDTEGLDEDNVWPITLRLIAEQNLEDFGPDFSDWSGLAPTGGTWAHVAVRTGKLPAGFDSWEWANSQGWTVAHEAAFLGVLPAGFEHWDYAKTSGWTVAHVAAALGHLPRDFDQWDLADETGYTVREAAAQYEKEFCPHTSPKINM